MMILVMLCMYCGKACEKYSLALFARGQKLASERGLILVDTKYEFGKDEQGNIILIDEIHTPDSSRYWIAESYEQVGIYIPSVD